MSSASFDVTGLISDAGRLQEELCARIPESEKKNLRIALGLEHEEVTPYMQKKEKQCSKSSAGGGSRRPVRT